MRVTIETMSGWTEPLDVQDLEDLRSELSRKNILRVAFRASDVYSGTGTTRNEKTVADLTQDDLSWLEQDNNDAFETRNLVVMSLLQ